MWKRDGSRETRRYRRRAIVRHDSTVSTYVFLSLRSMTLACEERISRAREFQEWEIRMRELARSRAFMNELDRRDFGNLWSDNSRDDDLRAASRRASRYCIKKKKFTVYYLYIHVDVYIRENAKKKILVFSLRRDREWREIVSLYIIINHFRALARTSR